MGLEKFKHKKEGKKNEENKEETRLTRRNFLLGALGASAVAGGFALAEKLQPLVDVDKSVDKSDEDARKEREKRENIHLGFATVLKKTTDPGDLPNAAELAGGAALGGISGIEGAGGALVSGIISSSMGDDNYYVLIKVKGEKPFLLKTWSGQYGAVNEGDTVPIKYQTDAEKKDVIVWAELFPYESEQK